MFKHARLATIVVGLLLAAGCAREPEATAGQGALPAAAANVAVDPSSVRFAPRGFADLPDRGELSAYVPDAIRRDGAYTWHRTSLSEAHAMRAMVDGRLRVTTPAGQRLEVRYDRHVEHSSGDWTWIGHLEGHPEQQTILTFGANAAFGTIAQPDGLPLRLTVRDRASWMVETNPSKVALIRNAATRPDRPDFKIPPKLTGDTSAPGAPMMAGSQTAPAAIASTTTVDLVLGYTPAFASENGGTSAAVTRLNYLVDVTNAAYTNSGVSANVRLVATVPVSYTDASSNDDVLEKLTGYNATTNTRTTPDPAFNALRAARETYGADLVSMVRSYRDPENEGCGIAWLIGGGQSGIATSDSYFGYSVVSDGTDQGSDGKTYYCLDETLAHELGHNMGSAHDVETSKGEDGTLDAEDYGAFSYSFGYKTTGTTGNFYTVMAYGDDGQRLYRIFSNPRSTFCGGRVCGSTNADNARTLSQTIPVVAAFRATVVTTRAVAHDFDGDGRSDVLWRNSSSGQNTIWLGADSSVRRPVTTVSDVAWQIVASGDFNGDGPSDILWRNFRTGSNVIWLSGSSSTQRSVTAVTNLQWRIVGAGDFNGDGVSDIFWRNPATGANVIWKSANSSTPQIVTAVGNSWAVVGIGDFNGDSNADVLWRNLTTGANSIWRSANASLGQAVAALTDRRWTVAGTGDFNGDDVDDILWRNTGTGVNAIWRSGNYQASQAVATVSSQAWKVAEVGDFNSDGISDLLWRNGSSGANAIWMSANASASQAVAAVPDFSWTIAP